MGEFVLLAPIVPLVLFGAIVFVFRKIILASWLAYFAMLFLAVFIWLMNPVVIEATFLRSLLISGEILLIIIGAFALITILQENGSIKKIQQTLLYITPDKRIHVILIGFFFTAFIEGAAGFGTPAALSAPLLAVVGIPPIAAAAIALIGDAVAVTYGAVGLPITLGIREGMSAIQFGRLGAEGFIQSITVYTAVLHVMFTTLIPLLLVFLVHLYDKSIKRPFFELVPFSLFLGAVYTFILYITAYNFGPEFPTLFASSIGMIATFVSIGTGFLLPRSLHRNVSIGRDIKKLASLFKPYIAAVFILLVTRLNIPIVSFFVKFAQIRIKFLFGTDIGYSFNPLLSPGIVFLSIALGLAVFLKMEIRQAKDIFSVVYMRTVRAALMLIPLVALVQIMIYSYVNSSNLPSMSNSVASFFVNGGLFVPFIAPFLGAVGTFISGSATVSNLMFTEIQINSAFIASVSEHMQVALQAMGSSIGNMVAFYNIIAVSAVVGLKNKEVNIFLRNIPIALIYCSLLGVAGIIFALLAV